MNVRFCLFVVATSHWELAIERLKNSRSGNDDFGVNHLLLEDTALALLVGGGHESVSLVLEPLADTKLVLSGTEETRLLLGVLLALIEVVSDLLENIGGGIRPQLITYIVQAKKNLALSRGRGCQRPDCTDFRESTGGASALSKQRAGGTGEVDGGACKYHCE